MDTIPQHQGKTMWSAGVLPAISIALFVAALAVSALQEKPLDASVRVSRAPQPGDYTSNWQRDNNIDLARTLTANHVDSCPEMAYRPHRTMYGEYLLYCSSDGGRRWTAYRVWTGSQRVAGPFAPDPLVPAPQ